MNSFLKISIALFVSLSFHACVARQVDQMPPQGEPPREMELSRFDTNQDGQITQDEISAAHLQQFKRLDTDSNGSISESEFKQPPPRGKQGQGEQHRPPPPPACENGDADCSPPKPMKHQQPHFKQLDTDGNGQVSQAEFMAKLPSFDRLDCDHNGIITQAEFRSKSCQASQ